MLHSILQTETLSSFLPTHTALYYMPKTPFKEVLGSIIEHYLQTIRCIQFQKKLSNLELAKKLRVDEKYLRDMYVVDSRC